MKFVTLLEMTKIVYQSGHLVMDRGAFLARCRHALLLQPVRALLHRLLHAERLLHRLALLPRHGLALLMVHGRALLPVRKEQ
jgi:hypothetical protein